MPTKVLQAKSGATFSGVAIPYPKQAPLNSGGISQHMGLFDQLELTPPLLIFTLNLPPIKNQD